eukprot:6066036-Amphidinium_carterae.2
MREVADAKNSPGKSVLGSLAESQTQAKEEQPDSLLDLLCTKIHWANRDDWCMDCVFSYSSALVQMNWSLLKRIGLD